MTIAEILNCPMGRDCADHVHQMLDAGARESGHYFVDRPPMEGDTAFLAFVGPTNRFENIVGVLTYKLSDEDQDGPPAIYPGILYVKPANRRKGTGKLLLTVAADFADLLKCADFPVWAMDSNSDMHGLLDGMAWDKWSFKFRRITTPSV